ncbi:hypothetical protein J437_LFUL010014 [Ladona fulva]|uniref:HECT-type E3 ubiquitin transferase n=1 Tax=Ladona fulva TaxID=123851 RepID=A0A8K0KER7_LADFU|nr:hypothetical protein J437_LFUL010014 [Ladona fulva]
MIGSVKPVPSKVNLEYDEMTHRISLQVQLPTEGCYHATVSYHGLILNNGDFDIIVLSNSDASLVHKNVATKNHNIWYEARLISIHGEKLPKPKKVFCYVSPKQLTIKEFLLKFIPKRLVTFRLCPSTKFHFSSNNNQYNQPSFVVDDGCQPKVELVTKDRNVIAATFTHFLLKNIGSVTIYFSFLPYLAHSKATLQIISLSKNLSQYWFQQKLDSLDWGGVRREWFELTCAALFDARNGLFAGFSENQQALVHPNPRRPSNLKLKHYEFAGRIVGKCLYESALGGSYRQLVRARFTRSFLAQLIGLRVHYKYFEQDDPDLYLTKVKYILEHDVDDMELYFVEEEYDQYGQLLKAVELVPGGTKIRVTNQTKLQYLDALAQYRLANSVREEMEHFLKGLNELIPDNLLSIFDENELEGRT